MDTIRVVLADDHPVILSSLQHLLGREADIEVIAKCQSGQDAITAVQTYLPDVLVLSPRLHELDAREVIRKLLETQITTRFLILSGQLNKEMIEEFLRAGASGYIAKDEAIECLVPAIKGVVQGAVCLSPLVKTQLSGPNDKYRLPSV